MAEGSSSDWISGVTWPVGEDWNVEQPAITAGESWVDPGVDSQAESSSSAKPTTGEGWNKASADDTKPKSKSGPRASRENVLGRIEDQFRGWYKAKVYRSTHLCIESADGTSTSEIAGLDGMTPGFDLRVRLWFDREQSCIELRAKFKKEGTTATEKHQKMFVRFYVDAAEDPGDWQFTRVVEETDLPPELADLPIARKFFKRGELHVLDMEYVNSNVITEGLQDRLQFTDARKLRYVEILRRLLKATNVKLFMRIRTDDFVQAFEKLKQKMKYERHIPPFHEYVAKSGKYTLQWGNDQFGPDNDTYERAFKKTFRKAEHHKLTHGYGVMRDSGVQLRAVLNSIDVPMMASFVTLPGPSTENGEPIYYLAFVQCDSDELIRDVYLVGESGVFCFEQPQRNVQPSGWHYVIKSPIGNYQYPGNLVMQINRPKGDNRTLAAGLIPEPLMPQQQVWAFPDASDLSPRRLVDCANLITSLGTDADEMRRYICALDLHEREKSHGLFSNMSQHPIIEELLKTLSASQLSAFEHIERSKHAIALIQGPPGTGKTTFIVTLLQILSHLGHNWIACAPSNSATDHLATVFERKCPEMGAIRFYAYESEARAIHRQERHLARQDETEDKDKVSNENEIEDHSANDALPIPPQDTASALQEETEDKDKVSDEDKVPVNDRKDPLSERLFHSYIADLQEKDVEWKGKKGRPNFKSMGLNVRALQNAGVIEHQIKRFQSSVDDHAEFRQALQDHDFDNRDKTEEETARYSMLEDRLMIDTIRKSSGVITTMSKTADNKLKNAKKPVIAIIDEAFKSYGRNSDDNLVNPFANQLIISFFERLWKRDFETYMFTEQYRLAAGLEEVFNGLFYEGKITNAPCTMIENRPGARNAIDYIKGRYNLHDGIPHVCVNVTDGVCLRGRSKSRFNPQNVATTLNLVLSMIGGCLWTEEDISIITPYREQAAIYRRVFRSQSLFRTQVFTADSVQGHENNCTIFDIVLAATRIGGWGFVREGLRLNVAISRSIDHFVLICDLAALNPSAQHLQELDQLDDKERQDRERLERETGKHLRGLFVYFEKKQMVHTVLAESLPEIAFVDMKPVTEFRRRKAGKYRGAPRPMAFAKREESGHSISMKGN